MPIKKENYYKIRRHFIKLCGNACTFCGTTCDDKGKYVDTDKSSDGILRMSIMEFDHIIPNGEMRHDVSRSIREWEWFDAWDSGNLQLLCSKCNKLKSDKVIP